MNGTFPESLQHLKEEIRRVDESATGKLHLVEHGMEEIKASLHDFVRSYERNHERREEWQKKITDGLNDLQTQRDQIIIATKLAKGIMIAVGALAAFAATVKGLWPLH